MLLPTTAPQFSLLLFMAALLLWVVVVLGKECSRDDVRSADADDVAAIVASVESCRPWNSPRPRPDGVRCKVTLGRELGGCCC